MINSEASKLLETCKLELDNIKLLLESLGEASNPVPYIQRYALIRATGAIETSFKKIIADKVDDGGNLQIKQFIERKVRNCSSNPKLSIIENMLTDFDVRWQKKFNELLSLEDKPKLKGSLSKLVKDRNEFAHGGTPDVGIQETMEYFNDGIYVLELLDKVVNYNYDEES